MSETHLITGGSGFLGSHLVKRILSESDDAIILLQRSPSSLVQDYPDRITEVIGDISNRKDVKKALQRATSVIHAGGIAYSKTYDYRLLIQTNVIGTTNLLESAIENNIKRFIYFSSAAIYGDLVTSTMDEGHPIAPLNIYGGTKAAADRLTYAFYREYNLPAVIIRPFNIYGPGQKAPMVIPKFIDRLLNNETIILYNGGRQLRDWLYIDDFIDALMSLLIAPIESVSGEAFNICSGKTTSLLKITEELVSLLNKDTTAISLSSEPSPHIETLGCAGDYSKLRNKLGWEPKVSLKRGLKKTLDAHRASGLQIAR